MFVLQVALLLAIILTAVIVNPGLKIHGVDMKSILSGDTKLSYRGEAVDFIDSNYEVRPGSYHVTNIECNGTMSLFQESGTSVYAHTVGSKRLLAIGLQTPDLTHRSAFYDCNFMPTSKDSDTEFTVFMNKGMMKENGVNVDDAISVSRIVGCNNTNIYEFKAISKAGCTIEYIKDYPPRVILETLDINKGSGILGGTRTPFTIRYKNIRMDGSFEREKKEITLIDAENGTNLEVFCGDAKLSGVVLIDSYKVCMNKYEVWGSLARLYCRHQRFFKLFTVSVSFLILEYFALVAFGHWFYMIIGLITGTLFWLLSFILTPKICATCAKPFYFVHLYHDFNCDYCAVSYKDPKEVKLHRKNLHSNRSIAHFTSTTTFRGFMQLIRIYLFISILLGFLSLADSIQIYPSQATTLVKESPPKLDAVQTEKIKDILSKFKGSGAELYKMGNPTVIRHQDLVKIGSTDVYVTNFNLRGKKGTIAEVATGDEETVVLRLTVSKIQEEYEIEKLYTTCNTVGLDFDKWAWSKHSCERCKSEVGSAKSNEGYTCQTASNEDFTQKCCVRCKNIFGRDCYNIYRVSNFESRVFLLIQGKDYSLTVEITTAGALLEGKSVEGVLLKTRLTSYPKITEKTLIAETHGEIYTGNICEVGSYECFGSIKLRNGEVVDKKDKVDCDFWGGYWGTSVDPPSKIKSCLYDTFYLKSQLHPWGSGKVEGGKFIHEVDTVSELIVEMPYIMPDKTYNRFIIENYDIEVKGCYDCDVGYTVKLTATAEPNHINELTCTGSFDINIKRLVDTNLLVDLSEHFSDTKIVKTNCNGKEFSFELAEVNITIMLDEQEYRAKIDYHTTKGSSFNLLSPILNIGKGVSDIFSSFHLNLGIIPIVITTILVILTLSILVYLRVFTAIKLITVFCYKMLHPKHRQRHRYSVYNDDDNSLTEGSDEEVESFIKKGKSKVSKFRLSNRRFPRVHNLPHEELLGYKS